MSVWKVTITTYEDDYKHRYDSGVYFETKLFSTEEKADNYVIGEFASFFLQKFNDDDDLRTNPQFKDLNLKIFVADDYTQDDRKIDLEIMRQIVKDNIFNKNRTEIYNELDKMTKGEFVEDLIDFEIEEDTIDDDDN